MIANIAALCTAAALLAGVAPALQAQAYPAGPINLVIPLAAGDATDLAARVIAAELARELRVPVVAVNRPGAGGALGTDLVVKATKDGQTIVLTNNAALVFRAVLDPQVATYDPLKDLTPLGLAMRTPSVLVVDAGRPYKSFREMVEFAQQHPGKVRVGTAGVGSVGDVCVQTINAATGAGITIVPFTGAAPALTALRGGHIEGVVLALGTVASYLKRGALRGLAISSKSADFPDLPTLAELGYAQPLFGVWAAFFAPAGVPDAVTRALVPALERAVKAPGVAAQLQPLGIVPDYAPPDQLRAEIRDEHQRVRDIVQKAALAK